MSIQTPGKRPFAPWLKDAAPLRRGQKKHGGVADLLLTPLIDMFVILVVFLIMNFSATGDFQNISPDIRLPQARATAELERAPVIQISPSSVSVEGVRIGDTAEIERDQDLRLASLTDKLGELRKVDELMHPGQPFRGRIIINAHEAIDFRVLRKVMAASAEAGYAAVNYSVLRKG